MSYRGSAYLAAGFAFTAGALMIGGIVYVLLGPGPSGTIEGPPGFEFLGGELGEKYGFTVGNATYPPSSRNISSPGPSIRVKGGELVRVTFRNGGEIPHSWAVVEKLSDNPRALFGAAVGSAARPLVPQQEGRTTFRAESPGSFFYMCTVPGHWQRGMYGQFIIEG